MEFGDVVATLSLALGAGGLIHALYMAEARRLVTLSVVGCAVITILVFWWVQFNAHEQIIRQAMQKSLALIDSRGMTFHEIYSSAGDISPPMLREALYRLELQGEISVSTERAYLDDKLISVRMYRD